MAGARTGDFAESPRTFELQYRVLRRQLIHPAAPGRSGSVNGTAVSRSIDQGLELRSAAPRRNRRADSRQVAGSSTGFRSGWIRPLPDRGSAQARSLSRCVARSLEPRTLVPNSAELDQHRGDIATSRSQIFFVRTGNGGPARQQLADFRAPRCGWRACVVCLRQSVVAPTVPLERRYDSGLDHHPRSARQAEGRSAAWPESRCRAVACHCVGCV